ncbi:amino acid ABC transporter permease [Metallumcola ferriviriculae]|uniref:Amino acid ABC transporter permease n=1 Tax=Metallumcola ferriviriculae TaxID=3039180 RepID=A0AAU0UK69_9FIRM|nr:amino acid ABC transporter permease [Desulfitibacteraceae bacterium MK1]
MDFKWDFVVDILPRLLYGSVLSMELTIIGIFIGIFIGLVISLFRLSSALPLKWVAKGYVDFFRGTPLLVQIMIIHFALPLVFGYTPVKFISGIAALGVNSGAYIAEIFRAGIQAVNKGQTEAARSLGMTWGQSMRYVILPQAFKISIPPLGNEFIALLKDSSLVFAISVEELMTTGRLIIGAKPRPTEVWITVAVLYLIMTRTISLLVNWTEKRFNTGNDVRL